MRCITFCCRGNRRHVLVRPIGVSTCGRSSAGTPNPKWTACPRFLTRGFPVGHRANAGRGPGEPCGAQGPREVSPPLSEDFAGERRSRKRTTFRRTGGLEGETVRTTLLKTAWESLASFSQRSVERRGTRQQEAVLVWALLPFDCRGDNLGRGGAVLRPCRDAR